MPFPLSKFIQLFPVSFTLNLQVFGFTQLVLTALVTQKHSILYLLFKYDFLSECELTDCGQQQAPPTRYSVFLGQLSSFLCSLTHITHTAFLLSCFFPVRYNHHGGKETSALLTALSRAEGNSWYSRIDLHY